MSLAEEYRKLLDKRDSVLSRVEKAKEKNEIINGAVWEWLHEMDELIEEMNTWEKKGVMVAAPPPPPPGPPPPRPPAYHREKRKESLHSLPNSTVPNQIFITFKESDTLYEFVKPLCDALVQEGFKVTADGKKGSGNPINAIHKTIERSWCSIIVFSENYAQSSYILNELIQILKYRKQIQQLVFPIFYKLHPSDVRYVRGSFGYGLQDAMKEAIDKLKGTFFNKEDMLKEWTSALYEVVSLPGKQYMRGSQDNFIQEIIEYVQSNKHGLHIIKHANGQEGRLYSDTFFTLEN